ncbi:sugar ABC transporter permease [Paenibacillus sp. LjRoot153]|uniref:carbohydrate ABC transporter permease n=1 Tax=Paenibacillus sp. LjRoot153 TaxID=3342270 RepID=UPI003ECC2B6D
MISQVKSQTLQTAIRKKKGRSLHVNTQMLGIALLIPAAIFIAFTVIIPVGWNFVLSFAKWSPLTSMQMVGLDNYIEIFKDQVTLNGFKYSIIIAIVSSLIALILGLLLALLVYRTGNKEGAVLRLIFFAPSMMPFIVIGLMFAFILDPSTGLINRILELIGLESLQHAWLSEPGLVLLVLAAVSGWKGSGAVMMLFYTAIVTIPASMFEAARLEGAGYFRQIRIIILPLIMPTIRLVSMLVLIGSFKTYDIVITMTKGGPGDYSKTVPMQMLDVGFRYNEFGYAAAIGVLFTILVGFIIFISMKMIRGDVYEY